ncbi:MAG: acetyltransferase [Methylobacterium sp.]|uniref:acetyltransferase n=1 Tax=Methylobacterium sp. TaxID=409 RepID=UPI0025DEEE96|nr:acetyltransferase [Methylobacterium sp.]MBX9931810.1 acetyltransferase [Methylobacterium sp.]
MTDVVELAFEAVRQMPPAERDSMAQAILTLARQDDGPLDIEPEHLSSVLEGLAQIERGEFTEGDPAELVAAAFRRHRP